MPKSMIASGRHNGCQLHLTQHKRFVPYGTYPNFCYAKTSFMLGTLYDIPNPRYGGEK